MTVGAANMLLPCFWFQSSCVPGNHCANNHDILVTWCTAMMNKAKTKPVAIVVAPTTEHMTAPMQKANPNAACKTCMCSATLTLSGCAFSHQTYCIVNSGQLGTCTEYAFCVCVSYNKYRQLRWCFGHCILSAANSCAA